MKIGIEDLLMPPALALLFLILGWPYSRSVSGGRPLNVIQLKMLRYGFWYVLGMGYLVITAKVLRLPDWMWVALIVIWSLLLALLAWWRNRQARTVPEIPRRPVSVPLREGLPMVGLLVCLICSGFEWESVGRGEGHWLLAVLCSAGVPGTIWLAKRNRRATVVNALRALLGLLSIGALAQPRVAALVAVGITGLALTIVEMLWKKRKPLNVHPTPGN